MSNLGHHSPGEVGHHSPDQRSDEAHHRQDLDVPHHAEEERDPHPQLNDRESPPLPPRTVSSHSIERLSNRSLSPPHRDYRREHLLRDPHAEESSRLSDHHSNRHSSGAGSPPHRAHSPSSEDHRRVERPRSSGPSPHSKDTAATSPPNVTVIQPSVNHPMFSYLYNPASMYASGVHPPSLPLSMGHMLFNSAHHSLPFSMPSDLSHLQGSAAIAAQAASGLHPGLLNGSLQALHQHQAALWAAAQNYPGASAHGAFSHTSPESPPSGSSSHLPGASGSHHLGPLFQPRPTHRYSPYGLPLTKTTMATTSAPLPATGSPHTSHSDASMTSPGHRSHGGHSPGGHSPNGSRSPPTPAHSNGTPRTSQATSELKNIERMVNGLEQQQQQQAVDSITKLTDK